MEHQASESQVSPQSPSSDDVVDTVPNSLWFSRPALVVAIIAILIPTSLSILSLVVAMKQQTQSSTGLQRDRLREIITSLTELRQQVSTMTADKASTRNLGIFGMQRDLLLSEAESIIVVIGIEPNATELIAIGGEYLMEGQYVKAMKCYEDVLANTEPQTLLNIYGLRNRAAILMKPGQLYYNIEEGRRIYEQAVKSSDGGDRNSLITSVRTIEYWMEDEVLYGNQEAAERLRGRAIQLHKEIGSNMGDELNALMRIRELEAKTMSLAEIQAWNKAMVSLMEPREYIFKEDNELLGTIMIGDFGNSREASVRGYVVAQDALYEQWSGVASINGRTINIDWQGVVWQTHPNAMQGQFAIASGVLQLGLSSSFDMLVGSVTRLGGRPQEISIQLP